MFILASLMQEPKHAVALCGAIEKAEGLFIEPGTLYRILAHLEQRGWIESFTTESPLRLYSITSLDLIAFEQAGASHQGEKFREGGDPDVRKGKEIIMRLVLWMLRLYPPGWRERYEAEMVALLEQHEITLWTVLDLLIGALDARLDPHYRRSRHLLPMLRLQTSWRWFANACVACWLGFGICYGMLDIPTNPAVVCTGSPGDTGCPMRVATMDVAIGIHLSPPLANPVVWVVGVLTFLLFLPFLLMVSMWIVGQAKKRACNLLRLLPVALFSLLCVLLTKLDDRPAWLYSLFQNGWLNGLFLTLFLASLVLVSESGGAMLISARSWETRHTLPLATFVRLWALGVLSGMAIVCMLIGVRLVDLWDVLPLLNPVFPGLPVQLMFGFVIMVVATAIALVALVRSTLALRAVSAASPKQDGVAPPRGLYQQGDSETRSRINSKGWMIVLLVVSLIVERMLKLLQYMDPPQMFFLGASLVSILLVCVVKKGRREVVALPEQEPQHPVHEQG